MSTKNNKESTANKITAITECKLVYEGKECPKHPELNGSRYVTGGKCINCLKEFNRTKDEKIRSDPVAWCFQKALVRIALIMNKKKIKKYGSPSKLLGCDAKTLYEHLFVSAELDLGSEYHIDHIEPLSRFDLTSEEDRKEAFHYTNLQALSPVRHMLKTLKEMGHNVRDPELLAIAKRLGEL